MTIKCSLSASFAARGRSLDRPYTNPGTFSMAGLEGWASSRCFLVALEADEDSGGGCCSGIWG